MGIDMEKKTFIVKIKGVDAYGIRAESSQEALSTVLDSVVKVYGQCVVEFFEEKSTCEMSGELSDIFDRIAGLSFLGQAAVRGDTNSREHAIHIAIELIENLAARAYDFIMAIEQIHKDYMEEDLKSELAGREEG
jgi:hypothetical protein